MMGAIGQAHGAAEGVDESRHVIDSGKLIPIERRIVARQRNEHLAKGEYAAQTKTQDPAAGTRFPGRPEQLAPEGRMLLPARPIERNRNPRRLARGFRGVLSSSCRRGACPCPRV